MYYTTNPADPTIPSYHSGPPSGCVGLGTAKREYATIPSPPYHYGSSKIGRLIAAARRNPYHLPADPTLREHFAGLLRTKQAIGY